ncbi:SRPBCC family protein [Limibacter armeniacum]|uniref:SRPBCC family protein n=1 Tax=Limibacter armeniacum TaxID=466084 RepID=UPI002FE5C918
MSLRKSKHTTLTVEIDNSVEAVFAYFKDMRHHVDLYPLVTDIAILGQDTDSQGNDKLKVGITEKISIGPFTFPASVMAEQVIAKDAYQFDTYVKASPNMDVHITCRFTELGANRMKLEETIEIVAYGFMVNMAINKTAESHETALQNLKAKMEAEKLITA